MGSGAFLWRGPREQVGIVGEESVHPQLEQEVRHLLNGARGPIRTSRCERPRDYGQARLVGEIDRVRVLEQKVPGRADPGGELADLREPFGCQPFVGRRTRDEEGQRQI